MDSPSGNGGRNWQGPALKVGALLGVVALLGAAAVWVVLPWYVERTLTAQFDELHDRTGMDIAVGEMNLSGISGLQIRDLHIESPDGERTLASIDELDATVDVAQTLRSGPAVSSMQLRGVRAHIHRHGDDTTDIDDIRANLAADIPEDELDDDPADDLFERIDGFATRLLQRFGDRYPDVTVADAELKLTGDEGASQWPASLVSTEEFTLDGDESSAPFTTSIAFNSPDHPNLSVPETADVSGTMRRPIEESTLLVDFKPQLRVANLEAFPFAEFALSSVEITEDYGIELTDPTVDSRLQDTAYQLASAQRLHIQFDGWPRSPTDVALDQLEVDAPRVFIEYDENGGSNLSDLYAVARQPSARQVTTTARTIGDSLAAAAQKTDDNPSDDEPTDQLEAADAVDQGIADLIAELPIRDWLAKYVPQRTEIHDLRLVVDDAREHDQLTNPADYFEITSDVLKVEHSPLQGLLEGDIELETTTADHTGSADLQFHLPYRTDRWNASVRVDRLELAHFAQLGGPAVARHLHGGEISAVLDVDHGNEDDSSRTRFDGRFGATDMRAHHEAVADDPIEVDSTSLRLDGFYDASMPLPEAELIDVSDDDGDDADQEDDELPPPDTGGFVIEEATARLGDVEADLAMGAYGLDGLRLPNRLTFDVGLAQTSLQEIVDSIPAAIRGPLDGIRLAGSLGWNFQLEVPLYEASEMRWDALVDLSPDFEVLEIPGEVDVFALQGEIEHTMADEWEQQIHYQDRNVSFERTVTIPEARPTPAQWLLDNTSLDLGQINRIRRQRQWPEIPEWNPSMDISAEEMHTKHYWLSEVANAQAADTPWDDDEPEEDSGGINFLSDLSLDRAEDDDDALIYEEPDPPEFDQTNIEIDPDRYGEYVYVPLHHISPYMVRAIKTTEDNSFFTHSGFNFLAIRQSVEQNINAGRYVRGASTISMQLAKNLFLELDRVLSRKLQEIALVWLMENVADVPKSRMMELYLNIIEFGPGIFGINEAAMHYFGKRPDQLNVGEVAWLVSIVPNPKRYHKYYERGEITPAWFNRMRRYIRAMEARDRISEREKREAMEAPPEFYIPEDGDPLLRDDVAPVQPDELIDDDEVDEEDEALELPEL